MVKHVKDFLLFHGFDICDLNEIVCWKCGSNQGVQVAHIDQKGIGGRESSEFIENYCPLCNKCHKESEGITEIKYYLYRLVMDKILEIKPLHQWTEKFTKTQFYKIIFQDGSIRK